MTTNDRGSGLSVDPVPGAPGRLTAEDPKRRDSGQSSGPESAAHRQDPVRWSSVWAGLFVALATFVLLELIFFALGWLDLNENSGSTAGWVTALIGLVAFLVGGMAAGVSSIWYGAREGVLQGVLVWALGVVSILLLSLLGGGAMFGAASSLFAELASVQRGDFPDVEVAQALETARDGAGWAVLGLVAYLAASAAGGALGAKVGVGKQNGGSVRR